MERAVIVCLKITDISYLKSRQNTPTSVVDEQVGDTLYTLRA